VGSVVALALRRPKPDKPRRSTEIEAKARFIVITNAGSLKTRSTSREIGQRSVSRSHSLLQRARRKVREQELCPGARNWKPPCGMVVERMRRSSTNRIVTEMTDLSSPPPQSRVHVGVRALARRLGYLKHRIATVGRGSARFPDERYSVQPGDHAPESLMKTGS
jgi:hypothetical protein